MGVRFEVFPAHVDEWEAADADPQALVLHNAELKAETIAARHRGRWVLAADTTVALDGEVLNKPADMAEARAMLKRLAGRTHRVFTGMALRQHGAEGKLGAITSDVTFQPLDDARIDAYFAIVNPLDKAGAYGIQEGREFIIDRYEGSLSNIMGLPTEELALWLEQLGLKEVFAVKASKA